MSQIYKSLASGPVPPDVPTSFVTPQGTAIPAANILNVETTNGTIQFSGSGNTLTLDLSGDSQSNIVLGTSLPSSAGGVQSCVGIGEDVFQSNVSSDNNVGVGSLVFQSLQSGSGLNTAVGTSAGRVLITGTTNSFFGWNSGSNYTSSESSNILIRNQGSVGESNTIRIGTDGSSTGQQNRSFMAGITGVTVSASAPVGIASVTGQLSSLGFGTTGQLLTSTGAASSPTWQNPITSNTASSTVASGSAISLTTTVNSNVTSISLSAGTWVVSGIVQFGGTPTVSGAQQASISTTSATHGTLGNNSVQAVWLTNSFTVGNVPITIPSYILTLGSTTTTYLVASGVFAGGTMTAYGRISAVRIA